MSFLGGKRFLELEFSGFLKLLFFVLIPLVKIQFDATPQFICCDPESKTSYVFVLYDPLPSSGRGLAAQCGLGLGSSDCPSALCSNGASASTSFHPSHMQHQEGSNSTDKLR